AHPRVRHGVSVSAVPEVKAIESVKQNRQPNAEQFQKKYQRKIGEKADLARISVGPTDGGRIRNQNMLEEKRAHRDDPRQRMQTAQNERRSLTRAQRSNSVRDNCGYAGSRRTGWRHR